MIGVPMEEHMERVFDEIRGVQDAILILKMDTPGGLVTSMSRIISLIADSDCPVVVWVTPSGASAASAGAFIVMASHVAAMTPGTNIGAAHPVTGLGGDIGDNDMGRKVTNDLAAKIRSFAQERVRNEEVAESMVTESVSLTAREALDSEIIDFLAADEDELFDKLDGRWVDLKGHPVELSLENRDVRRIEMTFSLLALELFSRPDIAYLALMAGIFLLVLEARAPGGFVFGVSGVILLLIAAYGMRVLPVNFTGLTLLVGGILVVIVDLVAVGTGLISLAGIGAMLFGGLMLYRTPGAELLNISAGFVVGVTLVIGVMFLVVINLVYKALRTRPLSGVDSMNGEIAKVLSGSGGSPMVFVHGEYWKALPVESYLILMPGDEVEVIRVESMTLYVKPVKSGNKT
jgi:membrane-bound serine protease (ClpP class)